MKKRFNFFLIDWTKLGLNKTLIFHSESKILKLWIFWLLASWFWHLCRTLKLCNKTETNCIKFPHASQVIQVQIGVQAFSKYITFKFFHPQYKFKFFFFWILWFSIVWKLQRFLANRRKLKKSSATPKTVWTHCSTIWWSI